MLETQKERGSEMTQNQRIVQYMRDFGSITPMEAFEKLGITKLATRIGEIARGGQAVTRRMVTEKNRYGETIRFMRYSLPK